ncbi:ribonuclease R [Sulfuriferula plumbiphila]|uniref:Ribonuclease R n=1 Tax=Sulfuriferula plumbiphila TaxID=171865 RepID=A0A512L5L4_9PROT|nr:ribonuclease R [Sulfuriferula plumbiphila]BBP03456.1 ribonuclease R [Sulfuriferula plumbiphila]GEP29773.1 ribonuclease R [Sulfuriferula plumbiphila]
MKKPTAQAETTPHTGLRATDPNLERERERYEHPLPSREFIMDVLRQQGAPLQPETLAELLDITPDEIDLFARRLRAMERDGELMQNRRGDLCVVEKLDLIKGRVEGHPDGFGFLSPDDGSDDLFLSSREMQKAMHGDRVMAREIGVDRRGRREGKIVEVLERANTHIVGRLLVEHGIMLVSPENKRITQDILIPPGNEGSAQTGQVVTVEIIEQPAKYAKPMGRVVEVLGSYADPGMEIEIALRKHSLPYIFPEAVEKIARKLPRKVLKKDHAGREDIRHLPLVTIDGETARDFDDAVYCEPQGKGFRLVVAIADVSHYVQPGDPLDAEAYNRGNSVYFPRRVIPMLPEELSNGLCSLNPQVERLCMVCDMQIGALGAVKEYRFYPAVMYSHARLTYNQVWDWLQHPQNAGAHGDLLPQLNDLYTLFKVLLKARGRRGAIDFETLETQMIFNDEKKIERIVPVTRNDAHRLIEECMLAANVCASDFLQKKKQPALYRIHAGPTPEKLAALREFLTEFGFALGGGDDPQARDYAALLEKIKGRPDAALLQTVMLRSLQQAVYSPDSVGHFGLAYEHYTHFTSPIRRYPDLLIHRAIKAALNGEKYQPGNWVELGGHCSMTERRADDATRDVEAWLKCFYMQDRVGEEFPGTISSVTGFGIFVALDDIYVEGLVHISELGSDYFHFDKARHQILGERTGTRYRMGDRVQVKIVRVSLDTARIDFTLAGASRPTQTAVQDQSHGGSKQPKKSAAGKPSHTQSAAATSEPAKKLRRRRKSSKGTH